MKLWIISDRHLEVNGSIQFGIHIPDADVCVVAGDWDSPPAGSVYVLSRVIAEHHMPVVYVAGNHEFYGRQIDACVKQGRAAMEKYPGLHFLENDKVILDGGS